MSFMSKIVLATTLVVSLYAVIVFLFSFPAAQRALVYCNWLQLPSKFDVPESYGYAHNHARNIKITTSDNVTLGAWHFVPLEYHMKHQLREKEHVQDSVFDAALADAQYDTVIYFHGNAMNRAAPWRVDLYKALSEKFRRLNIITIDYRGFGDSDGVPDEQGLHLDAKATLEWLYARNVTHEHISLIGHSLGTGVATALAYDMTKEGMPPNALILKAAYSSLPNLIFEYRLLQYLPILAPLRTMPPVQNWLLSKLLHKFDSLSRIEFVGCPILITYGAKDLEIPGHNSQQLFHRAIYGSKASPPLFTLQWLEHDQQIQRTIVPNEATVFKSATHRPQIQLVCLDHADHNNVGYFDYAYQAMADLTGWQR
ncbi:Alpha/Beta hydrolase protein [Radiomyces spectabilis]|uniref:Alpha/Beta hydrolase protein n=1 Tax=Radiomyces spectabilis TaxID=64574 RepID=UPI002220259C|nr:Alpha/Beta hydrolase protein [Radiomyces spectabilis]KAI8364713.1 Alpha/Beta hydrolase protein [Radiomyces spectabilis]